MSLARRLGALFSGPDPAAPKPVPPAARTVRLPEPGDRHCRVCNGVGAWATIKGGKAAWAPCWPCGGEGHVSPMSPYARVATLDGGPEVEPDRNLSRPGRAR